MLQSKITTVLLSVVMIVLGLAVWHIYYENKAGQLAVADLQSKAAAIEAQNQELASASAYFSSSDYLEKEARMKLNYKLPDEQEAFVYPSQVQSSSAPSAPMMIVPWWQKILTAIHLHF